MKTGLNIYNNSYISGKKAVRQDFDKNTVSPDISNITSSTKALHALPLHHFYQTKAVNFTGLDPVMRKKLDNVLNPKSIVVYGASSKGINVGATVASNIINGGFEGNVYVISRKGKAFIQDDKANVREITGKQKIGNTTVNVVKDIDEIPEKPDLAMIAIPASGVKGVLEDCGKKGVKGATVISSGFKEAGNKKGEQELVEVAERFKMPVIGPNCIGVANPNQKLNATFMPHNSAFKKGAVDLYSQSGAVGLALANEGFEGRFVSAGNSALLGSSEFLEYSKNDKNTKAIVVYMEDLENPQKFLKTLANVSKEKPVIIHKSGRTAASQAATAAHTGSAASGYGPVEKLFNRSGVIVSNEMEDLTLFSEIFEKSLYLPNGRNLAIVTNGGGAGSMATDAAQTHNLDIAKLSDNTKDTLKDDETGLPKDSSAFSNPNPNPLDTVADVDPDTYLKSLKAVLKDPDVDSVVAYLCPIGRNENKEFDILKGIAKIQDEEGCKKPVTFVFQAGDEAVKNLKEKAREEELSVPVFKTPEKAVKALGAMTDYAQWKKENVKIADKTDAVKINGEEQQEVDKIIEKAAASGNPELNVEDSTQILAAYGIKCKSVSAKRNQDPVEALEQFNDKAESDAKIHYPLVVKINSSDKRATHKSNIGGVILNIKNNSELRQAKDEVIKNAKLEGIPSENIQGVQIQEMVKGDPNHEIFVGITQDKGSGIRTATFGPGGRNVDIYNDKDVKGLAQTTILPMTKKDALKIIDKTPIRQFFDKRNPYRGMKPADKNTMADQITRLSQLAEDIDAQTVNVNPFKILDKDGNIAGIDSKIVLNLNKRNKKDTTS